MENTVSFIVARWTVFTELLPGSTLIKSVTIFWEVTVSAILSKKCICTCALFRTVSDIELFHCTAPKLLIRKRYYVKGKAIPEQAVKAHRVVTRVGSHIF
jgi:hypothetical protein